MSDRNNLPDDQRLASELIEARQELRKTRSELDLLRTLVGDRLEERGIPVAPEDVADVVRWAKNPDHVRRYLKHTPVSGDETEDGACTGCRIEEARGYSHLRKCWVAAAWRALGDPRGAEDIERAHEEGLLENRNRAALDRPIDTSRWSRLDGDPASDFAAARAAMAREGRPFRQVSRPPPFEPIPVEHWGTSIAERMLTRRESDARGMDAVEAEAWHIEAMLTGDIPFDPVTLEPIAGARG